MITGIEIYARANCTNDIPETLNWFSHRFGQGENKIALQWAAHYTKSLEEDPTGEPVQKFGWLVLDLALLYDKIFNKIAQPKTNCKRGCIAIDIESPTMFQALIDFHERFKSLEHTCKLESLLNLRGGYSKLRKLLDADASNFPAKSRNALKKLQDNLRKFIEEKRTPTCEDCYSIGDILVTLDQPPKTTLYHVDHSFLALCPIFKHKHNHLKSVLASAPGIPTNSDK